MTDSAFANFDLNLSKKLLSMLRDGYPARLKRVYIVTPPLWFKAMYKVLTPLLKEKMKERVGTRLMFKFSGEKNTHQPLLNFVRLV